MANAYHASSGSSQNPQGRQERRTVGANDRPHLLSELNSQPRQVPSATGIVRPCRSFCSREGNLPCGPSLDESDFCPVCRRQFLPLSPDRPLEARQAHTRACIEGYLRPTPPSRTSSVQLGPPLPHLPPATHMLQFVATEKDCLGEDGQAAECTICMEDYEVGQILARLECLCKFHKHCIVDWTEGHSERERVI
ncbi:Zinc finger, RING-type [Penicillium digitatum]|uniref:RING-type E3 ubiquitin transferase n=1 Tax=Penicillium digitatum TaxID=36651 RepID=A0A7T6XM29_PENDI|nr:Zinc finger, RING-type [Penicillium digitatum]